MKSTFRVSIVARERARGGCDSRWGLGGCARVIRAGVNAPAMVPESPGVGGFAAHAPLRLPRAGTFKKTTLFKRPARLGSLFRPDRSDLECIRTNAKSCFICYFTRNTHTKISSSLTRSEPTTFGIFFSDLRDSHQLTCSSARRRRCRSSIAQTIRACSRREVHRSFRGIPTRRASRSFRPSASTPPRAYRLTCRAR